MKPAYASTRFRAELPHSGLPEFFAVVTGCNSDGKDHSTAANAVANEQLLREIEQARCLHFPVTGGSPDFRHAEPGFGIVCDLTIALHWGRKFRQEAIFRVHRGDVYLVSCSDESQTLIGRWRERAAATSEFHYRGPLHLLDAPRTAFFCSTKCPGDKVLEAYAWARGHCDKASTVISSFHTPVEKDVLAILSRRGARILWVPARDLPVRIPASLTAPWQENRLLVLSPFDYGKPSRPDRESCSVRNRFVLRMAQDVYLAHAAAGSSLQADIAELFIPRASNLPVNHLCP